MVNGQSLPGTFQNSWYILADTEDQFTNSSFDQQGCTQTTFTCSDDLRDPFIRVVSVWVIPVNLLSFFCFASKTCIYTVHASANHANK